METHVVEPSPSPERARRGDLLIPLLRLVFDAVAVEASFLLSYWLRFHSGIFEFLGFEPVPPPPFEFYLLGSAIALLVWLLLFNVRKTYRARRRVTLADELIAVVSVSTVAMLVLMSLAFLYREFSFSRIVFGLIWMASIILLMLGRGLTASVERKLHRRGFHLRSAVIIGGDGLASDVYHRLHRHPTFGFSVAGYFADAPCDPSLPLAASRYCGTVADAPGYIAAHGIAVAFLALRAKDHERLFDLVSECEGLDVDFMMVPDVLDVLTSQVRLTEFEGLPFLTLKSNQLTPWGRITKRAMDVLLTSALLLLLSPFFLLIAVLIRLSSPGPVFYRQERLGLDGRPFTILKFRSMVATAEEGTGPRWTTPSDPRRTRIGAFLRKTSLDEIPQLLNVLRGDMSLVGPRPERAYFVEQFRQMIPRYLDRHRVKAGMTGWAQVNGLRGDTSIEERIKYDLYYIENWSLTFDVKILLRTFRAAFSSGERGR
jgi:exopolysaccharide biosynthesis polyprenyl glycosylphosphotransferase